MSRPDNETSGLRILTLDGGDLRAVSQLDILGELIRRVEWERVAVLPCQYFDVIVGVGTGGVIAILLVIFRMNVEEAKEEFIRIYQETFGNLRLTSSERSRRLKNAIYDLLDRKNLPRDMKLLDDDVDDDIECRVAVGVVPIANANVCRKLRNYPCREMSPDATVVEAICATCAFPNLFNSVQIGPDHQQEEFVGAKYLFNNPTREAIQEINDSLGSAQLVTGVVSLGCGKPRVISVPQTSSPSAEAQFLEEIASGSERTALDLERLLGPSASYYRLSVERGLELANQSTSTITARTKGYLEEDSIDRYLDRCIKALDQAPRARIGDLCCSSVKPARMTWGLPPLSQSYVIRPDAMNFLLRHLIRNYDEAQKIAIVSGIPGGGKTQLVTKFAQEYYHVFPNIIYVDASSEQTIRTTLIARVSALGTRCSTVDEAIEELANWDEEANGRWLLVLDNADNRNINFSRFFPRCKGGAILITTRDHTLSHHSPEGHLELNAMSPNEAVNTLLKIILPPGGRATKAQLDIANNIAEELGYLPVALVQAGCYIRAKRCLPQYLDRLRESRQRILTQAIPRHLNDYDHNIYAVFDVTVNKLSKWAHGLLRLLSCVHHTNFPRPLITLAARSHFMLETFDLGERSEDFTKTRELLYRIICPSGKWEWDADNFDDIVDELQQASLVTLDDNQDVVMLSMHPLLHAWAQDQLARVQSSEGAKEYRAAMARILSSGTGPEGASLHEHMISHIKALAPYWKELHVNDRASFADLLAFPGIADDTVEIWESVYKDVRRGNEGNDAKLLQVMTSLAWAYETQGDEKRCKMMNEKIENLRPTPDREIPSRFRSASTSAIPSTRANIPDPTQHSNQRNSIQSHEELIRSLVNATIQNPSSSPNKDFVFPQTPEFNEALMDVASQYEDEGHYREAEVLGKEWLNNMNRSPTTNPNKLLVMKYLSRIYEKTQNHQEAGRYLKMILGTIMFSNGRDHPDTLLAKEQLAANYQIQRRYQDAERLRSGVRASQPSSRYANNSRTTEHLALPNEGMVRRRHISQEQQNSLPPPALERHTGGSRIPPAGDYNLIGHSGRPATIWNGFPTNNTNQASISSAPYQRRRGN